MVLRFLKAPRPITSDELAKIMQDDAAAQDLVVAPAVLDGNPAWEKSRQQAREQLGPLKAMAVEAAHLAMLGAQDQSNEQATTSHKRV